MAIPDSEHYRHLKNNIELNPKGGGGGRKGEREKGREREREKGKKSTFPETEKRVCPAK